METELQELIDQFGVPEKPRTHLISRDAVLRWMVSDDIEVLGAVYSYIMDGRYALRIEPGLTLGEYVEFVTRYFERCFRENPDGDWSHSRYGAAWDLASWFGVLWKNVGTSRKELVRLRDWLARVYKDGDEPMRRCIVDGTLEHLFENREIARFFVEWKKDVQLTTAYAEAAEWSRKGGRTAILST